MSAPDAAALLPAPGQRGRTTIADRVVDVVIADIALPNAGPEAEGADRP